MTRVTHAVQVSKRPREVFEFLWTPEKLCLFMPFSDLQVLERSEREIRTKQNFTLGDETFAVTCVHQVSEPGRRIRFHSQEGPRLEGTWLLQDLGGGITKVTCVLEFETGGGFIARLKERLVHSKKLEELCQQALAKLKQTLEGQTD